jgi:hypothetical protein
MEFFFMEGNDDQLAIEDLRLEFAWLWQSCHISFITPARFLKLAPSVVAESVRDHVALVPSDARLCALLYWRARSPRSSKELSSIITTSEGGPRPGSARVTPTQSAHVHRRRLARVAKVAELRRKIMWVNNKIAA